MTRPGQDIHNSQVRSYTSRLDLGNDNSTVPEGEALVFTHSLGTARFQNKDLMLRDDPLHANPEVVASGVCAFVPSNKHLEH
jgi:hypothetical protein